MIQVDNAIEYFREELVKTPSEDWMYVYRGLAHESLYESSAREFERDLAERDYCRAVCGSSQCGERQQTSCGPVRTKRGICSDCQSLTGEAYLGLARCATIERRSQADVNYDSARRYWNEAIRCDDRKPRVWLDRATLCAYMNDGYVTFDCPKDAIQYLTIAIGKCNTSPQLYWYRGVAHYAQFKKWSKQTRERTEHMNPDVKIEWKNAEMDYLVALELDPAFKPTYRRLADLYTDVDSPVHDPNRAISLLEYIAKQGHWLDESILNSLADIYCEKAANTPDTDKQRQSAARRKANKYRLLARESANLQDG